jgi:hypothetical protein
MDIHDPKAHTAAIGVISTVVIGAIGYGGVTLHNMPAAKPPIDLAHFTEALAKTPKVDVGVYCGSCDERATAIMDALKKAGWQASIEPAVVGFAGVLITGPNAEPARAALTEDLGGSVRWDDAKDQRWAIAIGAPSK